MRTRWFWCTAGETRMALLGVLAAAALSLPACKGHGERRQEPKAALQEVALIHMERAEDAIRAGDRDAALAEFSRAIQVNPTLTRAHMGIGDIYRTERNWQKAGDYYQQAAHVSPTDFDAHYLWGLMLHLQERVLEAIRVYLGALALKPDDFQTTLNLATAYYQIDELPQALAYGERAIELEPSSGPARFNLGAIFAASGDHASAVREYTQATELMELNTELLMNLAESLGKVERFEEMRNTLLEVVKHDDSAAARERLGFAEFKLSNYDAATAAFLQALAIDPDYYPALNGYGVSKLNDFLWSDRADQEARAEAVRALRRSVQINGDQPRIKQLLADYGRN